MLFGKAKEIKHFADSLRQKKITKILLNCSKETKLTELTESNCNFYKKNYVEVTNKR